MKHCMAALVLLLGVVIAWPMVVAAEDSEKSLAVGKWSYKVVSFHEMAGVGAQQLGIQQLNDPELKQMREKSALNMLNQLGEDRWELVTVANGYFYFKRARGIGY